jgi:hypothetical protein
MYKNNKAQQVTRWQAKAYVPSCTHRRHSLWALSSGDTNAHELVSLCVQQLVSKNNKTKQMDRIYDIFWDNVKIGTTRLENGDSPMGVVFGVIEPNDNEFGYDFIKDFCHKKQIDLAYDYPDEKLISTRTIDTLKIVNDKGIEIKGIGNQITGMDGDVFEITIEGISYPFYEEEFPHHINAYDNMINDKK